MRVKQKQKDLNQIEMNRGKNVNNEVDYQTQMRKFHKENF